ncbi:mediator complex subunit [Pichia kluyveri]|uniref:Mediator of RNA polymerase II transcription subunit 10 n=1 Tax=Pichia kluyveri TaxID=36015 RepID=A0AAV5RAM6_PICKL|nr:mediator complex subunit [Pichia kluyveri]
MSTTTEQIHNLIETLLHLGVQVHDFQGTPDAKRGLSNNINKTLNQLATLANSTENADVLIPADLLHYVQDGRNPDVYTREFVEVVRKVNQHLHGRGLAFQNFQSILAASLIQEFPELTQTVADIRRQTTPTNT